MICMYDDDDGSSLAYSRPRIILLIYGDVEVDA